ncbi:MAG: VOC family protein [Candidatus Staskawiczbacteria bacterium]|jgi:catechol 2,3-dioxygenase-like lactoylglutathione lyase family enzyme
MSKSNIVIASRIRHVGIVVRNLEMSIKFYRDVLGFSIYRRCMEENSGGFIDKLTGLKGVVLESAKLSLPEGGLIELLQYHSHPDPDTFKKPENFPSNKLGCQHIAITVKDLATLYQNLVRSGYSCNSEPLLSPEGKTKTLYCHDPDGIIVELTEDL